MLEHRLAEVCFPQLRGDKTSFYLILTSPRLNYNPNHVHFTKININIAVKKALVL